MTHFKTAALAVAISGLAFGAAYAHPKLKAATPGVGQAVSGAPSEIRITFTEDVLPKFSGAQVKDTHGHVVKTAPAFTAPGDRKQLVVPLKTRLAPGTYRVAWHAVSADTHRGRGAYTFLVR